MRFGNLYMFAIPPVRILFYKGVKGVPDRIPPLTISRATYKTMRINALYPAFSCSLSRDGAANNRFIGYLTALLL